MSNTVADVEGKVPSSTPLIPEIQMLRFLAAAMVLFSHLQHEVLDRPFLDTRGFLPFEPLLWAGGVDIFFVISGFIMYYLSHNRFGREGESRQFILRRLIRIAPPYWACTLAMLLALMLFKDKIQHSTTSVEQVIGSFLFIPLPDPYGFFYPVLLLGWTLNFEMLFYVIFAVGLCFSRTTGMVVILAVLAAFGLPQYFVRIETAPFAFWCNPIVFEFLFGIGLAHLRLSGFRVSPIAGWALFVLGVALMVALRMQDLVSLGPLRPFSVGLPALIACAGPALIREPAGFRQGPMVRTLVLGGDASYALYLTHPFSINLVALAMPHLGVTEPWVYVLVGSIAAVSAGLIAHLLLEKPVTNWLNKAAFGTRSNTVSGTMPVGT